MKEYTPEEKREYAIRMAERTKKMVDKAVKNGIRITVDVKSTKGESSPIKGLRKYVMQTGIPV